MNEAHKYHKNIKMYVLLYATIGYKQKYRHKTSRRADMYLRCKSDFTAEIGQYSVGPRLCNDVIWHHSRSYIYIKHPTLQQYLLETSKRICNYTFL